MRSLRFIAAVLILTVLGGGAWAVIYAYDKGFTKKWRFAIMEEFDRRGIEAEIGKLTIDPIEGLVARNVKIFADAEHRSVLASINNITLDIDVAKMLRKQQFLNTVEFRDADLSLPIDPDDPRSERLEIKDFSARIQIPENKIEIERAECEFHGVRVTLVGSLLQPKPSDDNNDDEFKRQMELLKSRRAIFARVVEELDRLHLEKNSPPHLNVQIIGDLEHPETIEATADLRATHIGRGNYYADQLEIRAEYRHPDILIDEIKIVDEFGELHADARWRIGTETIPFNVESSIDSHTMLRSVFDTKALGEVVFYEKPKLGAEGEFYLSEEAAGGPTRLRMIGTFECGRFGSKGQIFEGAYADFSIDPNRWYLRNVLLDHQSGNASGNALYDSAKGIRYRAAIEMDPTCFVPFLQNEVNEKFISRFQFEENPTISLRFEGDGPSTDPREWSSTGHFTIGPCRYNEVPLLGATGKFESKGKVTTYRDFRILREEGHIDGDFAQVRGDEKLVVVKNVRGNVYPAQAASYFAPKTAAALARYKFLTPPSVTLNGTIDTDRRFRSQMVATFATNGPASFPLFRREIAVVDPTGSVSINGDELGLKLTTKLFDGEADYVGNFGLGTKAGNLAGELDARGVNFGKMAEHYNIPTTTSGTLEGSLNFSVPAADPKRWSGRGAARLTNGNVFAIPVMGRMSRVVNGVMDKPNAGYSVATAAQASFTIDRGVISTNDFQATTPGFVLNARGSIDPIQDVMNIDAEMNAKGALRLVGWPLSKLLKYKGEGSLSDPQWRPVNFSLPRRAEGEETILPAGRIGQNVPKAIDAGGKALEAGTKVIGAGAKLTRGVGEMAIGTSAKVTKDVGTKALETGVKVIETGTKGVREIGSKARDLVPIPRLLPRPGDKEKKKEQATPPAE